MFEKIILNQLYFTDDNLFYNSQIGFDARLRSTEFGSLK